MGGSTWASAPAVPRTDGVLAGTLMWWVVAEDPEREWARVGDRAKDVRFHPSLPGEPIDSANARLRFVGETVLPQARARLAGREA